LAGTTYNAVPLHTSREFTRSKNDRRPTHGRSPVWRADPRRSYERNVTETHTSRGRPSGMELPDYPVMALIPTPWDQDGPALLLPARSFPVLVARSAPRRVFSRTRTSFCSPPGLFPYSYLVPLPAGSFPVLVARSASRRVFSRTRTSFCSPPGLFPYSYLVPLPAGSFPVLVARSASRRVFSRTRTSFRFPPGLCPNSWLVILTYPNA
jgi:hypothetical protein